MCQKYQQAKYMISSLRQNSHVLAEQLLSRDEQYSSYLARLKERFLQLENELVETQRKAGLPVRLPYDPESARHLLSPPDELKRQPVGQAKLHFIRINMNFTLSLFHLFLILQETYRILKKTSQPNWMMLFPNTAC